ncbi:MAG: trehalose/maltose transport system permease protein [Nocardioidaceae bacterium]|nr:trehalose/maltose transport system permease protein [Nocardioidaceae bacterium]
MTAVAMIPSVRSRLWASGASFALGFGLANYGVLMVVRPDQWLWLAAAVVLMLTGAIGILFADTGRGVSVWALLGLELFAIFTAVPLLWTFTVATTPEDASARSLWPKDISWSTIHDVLGSEPLRHAALTSVMVSGIATAISLPLALGAAYALVRLRARGRRVVYLLVIAALLLPLVALTGPLADQLIAFDAYDSRLALVPPALLIALPLSIWLCVSLFGTVSWSLRDAVRADGATLWQQLRRFAVPALGPGVLLIGLIVFFVGCQDFTLGAALSSGDPSRPLPATLLLATTSDGGVGETSGTVAAVGLLWLVLPFVLLLAAPRKVSKLLGRSYR